MRTIEGFLQVSQHGNKKLCTLRVGGVFILGDALQVMVFPKGPHRLHGP